MCDKFRICTIESAFSFFFFYWNDDCALLGILRIKERQELHVAVFVEVTVSSCFLRVDKCGLVVSGPICVQPNWTLTVNFLYALHFKKKKKKNQSFV